MQRVKKEVLYVVFYIALLLLSVCAVSATLEENIYLVRPSSEDKTYLSVEDLSFYTCTRDAAAEVRSSLFCLDDSNLVNLETVPWFENCRLASFDLEEIDCTNLLIQSEYLQDGENTKITKQIKIRRVTSVLNQIANGQFDDGGWGDPESTAYAIWAYSSFESSFSDEIDDGLSWLKVNRHNTDKCWPKSSCTVQASSKVLSLLRDSDYTSDNRIVHDGEIYITTKQNTLSGSDIWQLRFQPDINLDNSTPLLQCLLNYSNSTVSQWTFVESNNSANATNNATYAPDYYTFNFSAVNLQKLDLACTNNITANITTHTGDRVLDYDNGDNLTYTLPGACWPDKTRWQNCSTPTTLSSVTTGVADTYIDGALDYLETLELSDNVGTYLDTPELADKARYIHAQVEDGSDLTKNSSELRWLLYQQNNDGSWGSGTVTARAVDTGYAIIALESVGDITSESVIDGKDWLSANEPSTGWSNIEQAALSFNALKQDIRSFIKSTPAHILVSETETNVLLYNPSTFNLNSITTRFSDDIEDAIEIDEITSLGPDESRRLTITQTGVEPTDNHGYLEILNSNTVVAKIPVSVFKFENIDITYGSTQTIFGSKGSIKLDISKTAATFTCDMVWDTEDISTKKSFVVSDQKSITLDYTLKATERRQADYLGSITCVAGLNTKKIPLVININQYPSKPLSVSPSIIQINESEQDFTFTVSNNLNEPISVNLKFKASEPYYQLETSNVVLNPKADRQILVRNLIPKKLNMSKSNLIQAEAFGQIESITLITEVQLGSLNFILYSAIFVFFLSILVVVGIVFRGKIAQHMPRMMARIASVPGLNKVMKGVKVSGSGSGIGGSGGSAAAEVEDLITKRKVDAQQLKTTIMINTIKILENLKKPEEEIRAKLIEEGFSDQDVTDAYKEIDTIEKEKKRLNEQQSTIAIIDSMNQNAAVIRSRLKQEGFSDRQIQTAFLSLRDELKVKESALRDELKAHGVKDKSEDTEKEKKDEEKK